MNRVLLISEDFVKELTNMSDNMQGKLINPAIAEAQEAGLREILGDCLMDSLLELVETGEIERDENAMYKKLLDKAQYYLAYQVITNVMILTAVKIDNSGLMQVNDEHTQNISMEDSFQLRDFYQKKADFYQGRLQRFILKNKKSYPELSGCDNTCAEIKSNLYSAASGGLWLGGVRGRK